ncbi:hypothetical protein ABZP36_024907 [Zizania latifolia]
MPSHTAQAHRTTILRRPPAAVTVSSYLASPRRAASNSHPAATTQCLVDDRVNYGNFMHGLMKENIHLNRKVLSELSMHGPYSFKALVDVSHSAFPGNRPPVKKEGLAAIL